MIQYIVVTLLLFSSIQIPEENKDFTKAMSFWKANQLDSAHVYFSRVIKDTPTNDEAYFWRAIINQESGDPKAAIDDYNYAIKLNPEPKYYNNLGMVYMLLQDEDKAMANFNQALDLDPGYSKAWFNKGILFQQQEEKDKACECFNKAYNLGFLFSMQFIEETCG